jgi:hypothetical protein
MHLLAAVQVEFDDDQEQDSSALTIAAERRRLQLNSSAVFTTAGPQNSRTGPQAAGGSSSGPRVGASGRSKGRVTAAAAAAGLFNTAAGGAGVGGGSVFAPAGTRCWATLWMCCTVGALLAVDYCSAAAHCVVPTDAAAIPKRQLCM